MHLLSYLTSFIPHINSPLFRSTGSNSIQELIKMHWQQIVCRMFSHRDNFNCASWPHSFQWRRQWWHSIRQYWPKINQPLNSMAFFTLLTMLLINKKVPLRERKRHTARRVASARYAALSHHPHHPDLGWGTIPSALYPVHGMTYRGRGVTLSWSWLLLEGWSREGPGWVDPLGWGR